MATKSGKKSENPRLLQAETTTTHVTAYGSPCTVIRLHGFPFPQTCSVRVANVSCFFLSINELMMRRKWIATSLLIVHEPNSRCQHMEYIVTSPFVGRRGWGWHLWMNAIGTCNDLHVVGSDLCIALSVHWNVFRVIVQSRYSTKGMERGGGWFRICILHLSVRRMDYPIQIIAAGDSVKLGHMSVCYLWLRFDTGKWHRNRLFVFRWFSQYVPWLLFNILTTSLSVSIHIRSQLRPANSPSWV